MRTRTTMGWLLLGAAVLVMGTPDPAGARSSGSKKSKRVLEGVVNINTASAEELALLPGVGPVVADRILEERKERPFEQSWELTRVKGIGPKLYRRMEPYLQTAGDTTLRFKEPKRKAAPKRSRGHRRRGPKILVFPQEAAKAPPSQRGTSAAKTVGSDFVGPPPLTRNAAAD